MNNNIEYINNYRKENIYLIVLNDNTRIGITLEFINKIKVSNLKYIHMLDINTYYDFVDIIVNDIDYKVYNGKSYIKLLDKYLDKC